MSRDLKMLSRKEDRQVNVVRESTDYAKFSYVKGNRETTERKDLIESIKTNGLICPIIVSNKLEVYEGQHRLECCEKLQIPVKYLISSIPERLIAELNTTQKRWTPKNYLAREVDKGNPDYVKFQRLLNLLPTLSINALYVIIKGHEISGDPGVFHSGKMRISDSEYTDSLRSINFLLEIIETDKGRFRKALTATRVLSALIQLIRHTKYNHKLFLKRLNTSHRAASLIKSVQSKADAISMLESVYNYGLTENKTIVLATKYTRKK